MNKQNFFNSIADLLELEGEIETNESTSIDEILEIDSLAHITIISYVMEKFDVELKAEKFSEIDTLNDLINLIGKDKFSS